jgi:hypothetical protein
LSIVGERKVRCRQIGPTDLEALAGLLSEGFPLRSKTYWMMALRCLGSRATPEGFPKWGYMLEAENVPVGVLLLLTAAISSEGSKTVRCNVSSWYVRPDFRSYGAMLSSCAGRYRSTTYVNIDPATPTRPIIEAQGFRRFGDGVFAAILLLSLRYNRAKVTSIDAATQGATGLRDQDEERILRDHSEFGCISLCCETPDGDYPFVFRRRLFKRLPVPCAELVYCRNRDDLVRFAGPLGKYLALRGMPWVIMGSTGPVTGLIGRYLPNKLPMYYKGANPPRLGDLAYTEVAVFGL